MKRKIERYSILLSLVMLMAFGILAFAQQTSSQPTYISTYIRVVYPNGGEVLRIGSTYRITWNASSNTRSVGIQLFNNQRRLVYTVTASTTNSGTFLWTIPSGVVPAQGFQIKIYDTASPAAYDVSDQTFTIESAIGTGGTAGVINPSPGWSPETELIKVLSPVRGNDWIKGSTYDIRWEAPRDTTFVNLFVSFDDGQTYSRIDLKQRARNKRYRWRVSRDFYTSPNCRIKVTDYDNPYIFGTSARFTIQDPREKLDTSATPVPSRDDRRIILPSQPQSQQPTPVPTPIGGRTYMIR